MAYEGMAYRAMAENIKNEKATTSFPCQYIFIGFNALNECEKILFRFLKNQQKADFYWDYDTYYINDTQQEAGLFLRENIKAFPPPDYDADFSPFSTKKQINLLAAPSNLAQTKIVPQLLEQMNASKDERTAIVLADEQLLTPLLHVLPSVSKDINITMGYPFRQTGIYSLIELLLQLFNHSKRAGTHTSYYYKDILSLLANQYIKKLINNDINTFRNNIVSFNNIYVSNDLFNNNQALKNLLAPVDNYGDISNRLLFLMDNLSQNKALIAHEPFLKGHLQHIVRHINKLSEALKKSTFEIPINLYIKLLKEILQQDVLNPCAADSRLQQRNLKGYSLIDFKNIIVLSANEGILPRKSNHISFIPYNLRRGFGLPTPEQQEAVWAYYFYRLLQRAQNITLIYSTKADGIRPNEASRYLLQLKLESGHTVNEETLSFDINIPDNKEITINKTPEILSVLNSYCGENPEKKLSPSALNTYLSCSLKFYFKYVAGIKESDDLTEKVDSRLFGNLLHKSMELIYNQYIQKEITNKEIDHILKDDGRIRNTINQSIAEIYYRKDTLPADFYENGDLLMVHDILFQYIKQLLIIDRKQAPFIPEGLELATGMYIPFTVNGEQKQLLLGGIIDRLHYSNNTWYVIDYKTGLPDNEVDDIDALFGADRKKQHPAILQTLLYSLSIYNEKQQPVTPFLYFLRDSYNEQADFSIYNKESKKIINNIADFAEPLTHLLSEKLSELFDTRYPFTQTTDNKTCEYCPYNTICSKTA